VERVSLIDTAKGLSILLVALHHSNLKNIFPELIEPMGLFRMPTFFLLSGIFFSFAAPPTKFFLKKTNALLKPYFVVLIALSIINLLTQNEMLLWYLKGMFWGNGGTIQWVALWYLTHLFVLFCSAFLLCSYTPFLKIPSLFQWLMLLILLVFGSSIIDLVYNVPIQLLGLEVNLPGLPFSIDILPMSLPYFLAGYLLRATLLKFKPNVYYTFMTFVILITIITFTDAKLDFNERVFQPFPATVLASICGIYLLISFSWICTKVNFVANGLQSLGSASLFILLFHIPIGGWFYNYSFSYSSSDNWLIFCSLCSFILSFTLPIIIKKGVASSHILSLLMLPTLNKEKSA